MLFLNVFKVIYGSSEPILTLEISCLACIFRVKAEFCSLAPFLLGWCGQNDTYVMFAVFKNSQWPVCCELLPQQPV